MKEHYTTYSQAVKLKELGFAEKVNHAYLKKISIEPELSVGDLKEVHSKDPKNYNDNRKGTEKGLFFYSAPRLDQAAAWLREVKGWDITSIPTLAEYGEKKYRWDICHWYKPEYGNCSNGIFDTYELALSAGIDAALELLTDSQTDK